VVPALRRCWENDKYLAFLTFIDAKLKVLYVVLDEIRNKKVKNVVKNVEKCLYK